MCANCHVVTVKPILKDITSIRAACTRLQLPQPIDSYVTFYDGQLKSGWLIPLPNWQYPVIIGKESGEVHYDNYGGKWGEQADLDMLLQVYAIEKTKLETQRKGYTHTETKLANGARRLTINVY